MRILQVITLCELGGAQSVVVNLANSLCEEHEVLVAAGDGDGKMFELLDSRIQTKKIDSLLRQISPVNELKTIIEFRNLYKEFKPDIIHLHSSKAGLLGRLSFPKAKIVYTVHGFDSIRKAHRVFLPLEKALQRRCASIVAVSRYDYANLLQEGIRNNVSYIHNGVPQQPQEKAFSEIPYEKKVLSIARMAPPKRFDLFIAVAEKHPDIGFIWIGNQTIPEYELPPNVFLEGNVPNASRFIGSADVFMLLSDFEGLPMVLIESLAAGTPVIASNVGGISEIIEKEVGAVVSNNVECISNALGHILNSNIGERKKKAVEKYKELFTVEQMTSKYLDFFNTIYKKNK